MPAILVFRASPDTRLLEVRWFRISDCAADLAESSVMENGAEGSI